MTARLVAWLWRHGRRPGLPTDRDDTDSSRQEIETRQAAVEVRLRALRARAAASQRPPTTEEPPRE